MATHKYQILYENEIYRGNSIDAIANRIISDFPDVTFPQAVTYVNKSIVPVVSKASTDFNPVSKVKPSLTIADIRAGATSAMKQIGGDNVSQEEITRRSNICVGCPALSDATICIPCGGLGKLRSFANSIKNFFTNSGYHIPKDVERSACSVCKCSLAMMIPAPLDHFRESTKTDPTRPARCWLKD